MKKTLIFISVILLSVFSCVNTSNEKTDSTNEKVKEKNACDEFLAHYEQWADKYFNAIEDYINNPSDEEIGARYMELMQQAMDWSNEWIELVECADDEEYKQRFEEISLEIEDKIRELQL
ncbi:MAG: hypothetical protein KQH79_10845 [Bacteroidetes bacterium]|nr:hypothetical protein [Bacteroidota bacterium]